MSGDVTPPIPPADPHQPAGSSPAGAPVPGAPAETPSTPQGPENVLRGFLLSLIVVPAGIALFTLLWNLGFISAIVGFGVAFGAFFLYRLGSGGRISMRGALIITGVTLVTLVIAFLFATVGTYANYYADQGASWWGLMLDPSFWGAAIANELEFYAGDFALNGFLTLLFGGLGCFAVLRNVFTQARQGGTPPVAPPAAPPAA